ncbi:MAG: flagellar protein FlbB [Rhodobiaceae bacterium]|nr:flagellar protein FlbB [Rhodobiaceae bacterium]MCC0012200.1 flagellar protein FlbB [Rhodobiaceae bacterium]MCC0050944.1 flagellar protein FlbB [Rhodobiaceae bacterium]MCC0060885.1 flagellar protein FlbB [Rhodobiaceae bacterium]
MKKVSVKRIASLASREVRVLPVLAAAAGALLLLKGVQIAMDAPGAISGARMAVAQDSEPPAAEKQDSGEKPADTGEKAAPETAEAESVVDTGTPVSAEEAINARLSERRKQLEKFETDLKMRESLLRAAELRIEQRLSELKSLESRLNATLKEREEQEAERFKNLVTMYQAMKPKDAAAVFDRLDTQVLVEVASGMDPRTMAEIVSKMTPEGAERLTIALMNRAAEKEEGLKVQDLPQIVGTQPAS